MIYLNSIEAEVELMPAPLRKEALTQPFASKEALGKSLGQLLIILSFYFLSIFFLKNL